MTSYNLHKVSSLQVEAVNLIGIESSYTNQLTFIGYAEKLIGHFWLHHSEALQSLGIECSHCSVQRAGKHNVLSLIHHHPGHLRRVTLHVGACVICCESSYAQHRLAVP
jgi:hypothetical protein